jgi:uncharacterized membrane protein
MSMSGKSRRQKHLRNDALAEVPDNSLAALVRATSPDVAQKLDARTIRLLGSQPITQVTQHSITATMWQGPVPPPDQLAEYNNAAPNGASIILQMAQDQAKHRQALEGHVIPEQLKQSARGQLFGLTIGLAGILGAVVTSIWGSPVVAGLIATGSLGTLAVSFLGGKSNMSKQMKSRDGGEGPKHPMESQSFVRHSAD